MCIAVFLNLSIDVI